jgi:N-acetyl sugar amidotransferase
MHNRIDSPATQVRDALARIKSNPRYRECTRCVMDTSHSCITFDPAGVCNYCLGFDQQNRKSLRSESEARLQLDSKIANIKEAGRGKQYDCVLGLSGGVDSSFLALKCKDWGIRPLLVQFDNGWNTEIASSNIQKICSALNFDLYTFVVDWDEFRDLQLSFLRAGLANLEAPSDHGIFACIYRTAVKLKIPWLLSGVNDATEGCFPILAPATQSYSYGYRYTDLVHIRAVHRTYGSRKLKTFPVMGLLQKSILEKLYINRFDPLNYLPYNKSEAIAELARRVEWRPYPGKHFESVITRFHQSYILPVKFGMDKRRLHLSGLIWSSQCSRAQAALELQEIPCDARLLYQDYEFFIKKLKVDPVEFDQIMSTPPRSYAEFQNIDWIYRRVPQVSRIFKQLKAVLPL